MASTSYRRLQSADNSRVHPVGGLNSFFQADETTEQKETNNLKLEIEQKILNAKKQKEMEVEMRLMRQKGASMQLDYQEEIKNFIITMDKNLQNSQLLDKKEEEIQSAINKGIEFYLNHNENEDLRKWEKKFDEIMDDTEKFNDDIDQLEENPTKDQRSKTLSQLDSFEKKLRDVFQQISKYQGHIEKYERDKKQREEELEKKQKEKEDFKDNEDQESNPDEPSQEPGYYVQKLYKIFEEFKSSKQKVDLNELQQLFPSVRDQISKVKIKKDEELKVGDQQNEGESQRAHSARALSANKSQSNKQAPDDRNDRKYRAKRHAKDGLKHSASELVLVYNLFSKHFMKLVKSFQEFKKYNGNAYTMDHLANFKLQERPPSCQDTSAYKFISEIAKIYEDSIKKVQEKENLTNQRCSRNMNEHEQEMADLNNEKQICESVENEIDLLKKLPIAGEILNKLYQMKKNLTQCLEDEPLVNRMFGDNSFDSLLKLNDNQQQKSVKNDNNQNIPNFVQNNQSITNLVQNNKVGRMTNDLAKKMQKQLEYDLVNQKWMVKLRKDQGITDQKSQNQQSQPTSMEQHWRFFADGSYVSNQKRERKKSQWSLSIKPDQETSPQAQKTQKTYKICLNLNIESNEYKFSSEFDYHPASDNFKRAPAEMVEDGKEVYKDQDMWLERLGFSSEQTSNYASDNIFKLGENNDKYNGFRMNYLNFMVIRLKIIENLKSLRNLLLNYEEKFKSQTKTIIPLNMFMSSLIKSQHEDQNNQNIKMRGINEAAAKFDNLEPLFKFCQVSETQNLENYHTNLKKAGAAVSKVLSDETYMLNLFTQEDQVFYVQDIISIDKENDDRYEFLLFYRKSTGGQQALWSKRFSFTDYSVQKNSEPVKVTDAYGGFWASTSYAEYLTKKDKFFRNKYVIYGNINDPDGDSNVSIIQVPTLRNKIFEKSVFEEKINNHLNKQHSSKIQPALPFKPIRIATTYTRGRSTLLFRESQIVYLFEVEHEIENKRFYYAVFDVKDEEGSDLDINCVCAKPLGEFVKFRPDEEFYFQNPMFLSQDLLCFEIHSKQYGNLPDTIVFFEVERDKNDPKSLKLNYIQNNNIDPSPKPESKFWLESIDQRRFAVFADEKLKVYEIIGKTQISKEPIFELECDHENKKSNCSYIKNQSIFQTEILGTEQVSYQGLEQNTMKNYLYWDNNRIKRIPCHFLGQTSVMFKFNSLCASLSVHDDYQGNHFGNFRLKEVNFCTKIMQFAGIKDKKSDKIYCHNNFYVNFTNDNNNIESGLISPYSGTFSLMRLKWTSGHYKAVALDDQGQVCFLLQGEDKTTYTLKIFDSIDLQYSWEMKLDLKTFLREEDEEIKEEITQIKFGKYDGPFIFLVSNLHRILAISTRIDPQINDPLIMQLLEPNEQVTKIEFAPNMQWVIQWVTSQEKKENDKGSPEVILLSKEHKIRFKVGESLKNQEKSKIKNKSEYNIVVDEKTAENAIENEKGARGIDHIQFSQYGSTKEEQQLLIVYDKRLKNFTLKQDTTEWPEIIKKDTIDQIDEKDYKVKINSQDQDFPIFNNQNDEQVKILEVLPFDQTDVKFILMVQDKQKIYLFNLQDMTVRNHAQVVKENGYEDIMKSYVDNFNNLMLFNYQCFFQMLDLDNAFNQKINQQSALHTIVLYVSKEKIQRQFFKTYIDPDQIFRPQSLTEFKNSREKKQQQGNDVKEDGGNQSKSKLNNDEEDEAAKKKIETVIDIEEFINQLKSMTNEPENIDFFHEFKFNFPQVFLDMLYFGKMETQTVNYIEKVEFKELISTYRQFANMNSLSIFIFQQPIVESILSKHDGSNKMVFYKQSKLWMDLDMLMDYQEELIIMENKFGINKEKKYIKIQQIIQIIVNSIGYQHDQLTQLYISEKLFRTDEKRYQNQNFDFTHIKFTKLLDSKLIRNDLTHNAIPPFFKDQTVIVNLKNKDDNLFDKYFIPLTDKHKLCKLPGLLDFNKFYDKEKMLFLVPEEKNNKELVKAQFFVLSVQGLIEYNFISQLYFNMKQGDQSLYSSQFVKNFIDYAWEQQVGKILRRGIMLIVIFIIVHFINMLYLDMDSCGPLSIENCEPKESFFAIYNGRKNLFVRCINYSEIFLCIILLGMEARDFFNTGIVYFNNIWNTVDIIMPTSFLAGYYYDKESVATSISRVLYTITTLSLMFVLFQKLKLTKQFSFMVVCIIACITKIYDFILFLFVLICFLTVSYTNLGYTSPLIQKQNIFVANFFSMFKMAMGESQTDENEELEGITYGTAYILFVFFIFFTTIVYMNILIAVVSDEFEKVYEERALELYKIRLPYIINYWQLNQGDNDKLMINNCVLIVPEENESKEEWTGWIAVVKKHVTKLKTQIIQIMVTNQQEMKELITKSDQVKNQKDKDISFQIATLEKKLDAQQTAMSTMSSELKSISKMLREQKEKGNTEDKVSDPIVEDLDQEEQKLADRD